MALVVSSYSPFLDASFVGAGSLDELQSRDLPKDRPYTRPGLSILADGEVTEDTGNINSNHHQCHPIMLGTEVILSRVLGMHEHLNNELRNRHCIAWRWYGKVIPLHMWRG